MTPSEKMTSQATG